MKGFKKIVFLFINQIQGLPSIQRKYVTLGLVKLTDIYSITDQSKVVLVNTMKAYKVEVSYQHALATAPLGKTQVATE